MTGRTKLALKFLAGRPTQQDMQRILAVDDDPLVLAAVSRVLARQGYEVVRADSGSQALALARGHLFDAAIVDLQMPGPNGIEVLRELCTLQPRCMRILASGALDLPITMEAVNQGWICKVVAKPFSAQSLSEAVDQCLAARSHVEKQLDQVKSAAARERARQLAECLAGDQLQLAVQPIVSASGELVAHEALLRSTHPVLEGPMTVLAAAEAEDALDELGSVVVDRALEWIEHLPGHTKLFINLHPRELANPAALVDRLSRFEGQEGRIVLEITERSQLSDLDGWERSVAEVTRLGFAIAVDDLGAGYSSLAILADLRPAYVKVDMSIVRGCDTDAHRQRILALLCQFAEADGATLIAEGVETEGEEIAACRSGAHWLQGYWLGRPQLRRDWERASQRRAEPAIEARVGMQ